MNARNDQTYQLVRFSIFGKLGCTRSPVARPLSGIQMSKPLSRRSWWFFISDLDAVPPALLGTELPIQCPLCARSGHNDMSGDAATARASAMFR
jgi:hypothetical protein